MAKLKLSRVHKAICHICNGNGFIKIVDQEDPSEVNIHQCWDCDSEGEFYETDDYTNGGDTVSSKLH